MYTCIIGHVYYLFLPDVTEYMTTYGLKHLFWLMVSGDISLFYHGRHTGTP